MISAYILKKQGHQIIGVSVIFNDEENPIKYLENWKMLHLKEIQRGARILNIAHYAVDAQDKFKNYILDAMVGARLSGYAYDVEANINILLTNILHKKMKKLKGDSIATGHFSKIQHNDKTQESIIYSLENSDEDQSEDLVSIKKNILQRLELPLGDLRYKDVKTLALQNFPGYFKETYIVNKKIMQTPTFAKYVESVSSSNFWKKEKNIYHFINNVTLSKHSGIHHFYHGQDHVLGDAMTSIDKTLQVIDINVYSGDIILAHPKTFRTDILRITHFSQYIVNISLCCYLFVKFYLFEKRHPCFVTFKNNNIIIIELKHETKLSLSKGIRCTLYSKSQGRSEVVGSGIVESLGVQNNGKILEFPYILNTDEKPPSVNHF